MDVDPAPRRGFLAAFQRWTGRLAGQGFGGTAEIAADIEANLLPGVVTVPAMVIAIGAAQRVA